MCPNCMAGAVMVVGGVTATGGLSALLVKVFRRKKKTKSANDETQKRR